MNAQLQTFKNAFLVNNNINKVWEFYTDIDHLKITPKEINLKVINATDQKFSQGTEIWIKGKILISKRRSWHSIITFL
jgi:ligand-binding SRPBCC domain-containing protein